MRYENLGKDARIYNGDCLQILRSFKSVGCFFDACITDPPYGNNTEYRSYADTRDNLKKLIEEFMPLVGHVSKSIFITCGVANMWLYPEPTWTLSWVNPAGVGSSSWGFSCWQPILAYGKDPYLQDGKGRRPDTLFQRKTEKDDNDHPCPKPDNVMRWIIERTTREGDTIIDPFMGSGSTGVACIQTKRKFVGIELDKTYCDIAKERIAKAQMQPRLF